MEHANSTINTTNYGTAEGVTRNGWISPSRVLAGSEHWGCAPKDTQVSLGRTGKRAMGPEEVV